MPVAPAVVPGVGAVPGAPGGATVTPGLMLVPVVVSLAVPAAEPPPKAPAVGVGAVPKPVVPAADVPPAGPPVVTFPMLPPLTVVPGAVAPRPELPVVSPIPGCVVVVPGADPTFDVLVPSVPVLPAVPVPDPVPVVCARIAPELSRNRAAETNAEFRMFMMRDPLAASRVADTGSTRQTRFLPQRPAVERTTSRE